MEDSEIFDQMRAGHSDAFGKLVERYQRQLYYFVVGKVAEHGEAQDIVQKSFVTAYQNLDRFVAGEPFFPWVRGIALNHCRNEWRRYHSQSIMKERLIEARRAELELELLEKKHDESNDRVSALRECMQKLTQEEQDLVERRFVQELSMEEIGVELSKGSEAVRLWLYRVRVRLADCVKRRMAVGARMETT